MTYDPAKGKLARDTYDANHPERSRENMIKRKRRQKERLAQTPRPTTCEVCGGDNKSGRVLSLDHDHRCCAGCEICARGWLCSGCNLALGMVKDRPEVLRALANYLEVRSPVLGGDWEGSGWAFCRLGGSDA